MLLHSGGLSYTNRCEYVRIFCVCRGLCYVCKSMYKSVTCLLCLASIAEECISKEIVGRSDDNFQVAVPHSAGKPTIVENTPTRQIDITEE